MLGKLKQTLNSYPRQFWLLFGGGLVSSTGTNVLWPFFMVYVNRMFDVPLTNITIFFTLESAATLVATYLAGPVIDRTGRKKAMVLSLCVLGLLTLGISLARELWIIGLLFMLFGLFGPMFGVGQNAMLADLLPEERRSDGYAIMRIAHNAGVVAGPLIGSVLVATSFRIAFDVSIGAEWFLASLILLFAVETLPKREATPADEAEPEKRDGSYGPVLRDRRFMLTSALTSLTFTSSLLIFVLMVVYMDEQFGLPQSVYASVLAVNAGMIVFLQVPVARVVKRYPPLLVMAIGGLFNAAGILMVAFAEAFPGFLAAMIVVSIGELILAPTAVALAANLAPEDMRARYMGINGLTFSVAAGLGPLFGGLLSDLIAPVAVWYGGFVLGMLPVAGFLLMQRLAPMPGVPRDAEVVVASPAPDPALQPAITGAD